MDNMGADFDGSGSVMTPEELTAMRKRKGECVTCGRKCFKKKLFKFIPLTEPGLVDNGVCLRCTNPGGTGGSAPGRPRSAQFHSGPAIARTPIGPGGVNRTKPTLSTSGHGGGGVSASMPPLRSGASADGIGVAASMPALRSAASAGIYTSSERNSSSNRSVNSTKSSGSGGNSGGGGGAFMATAMIAPADEPVLMASAAFNESGDAGYGGGGYSEIGGAYDAGAYDDYGGGYDDVGYGGDAGYGGEHFESGPIDPADLPPIPPLRGGETATVIEGTHPKSSKSHSSRELEALKDKLSQDVDKALEDLATFELSEKDMDKLEGFGVTKAIAEVMGDHLDNITTQKWGCSAVWNLSGIRRTQRGFIKAGILDSILPVMEANIEDAGFQEQAISALSNLSAAKDNFKLLLERDVLNCIINAMNQHTGNMNVQIKACTAITNLASHGCKLKANAMDSGAGEAVVIAMVMNPNDINFLAKALRALRNLTANSDENRAEVANAGGVDSVISAMQVHRDEAEIQEESVWTLANLATINESKEVIGDCGGIDVIVRTLWVHSEHHGCLEKALRALFNLSTDEHNAAIAIEVGGIPAIVSCMQGNELTAEVQEMGLAVLYNLAAQSDENKMRIVDEEALDAIVLSMVLHPDDAMVNERACLLLKILCIPDNYKPMLAANIIELVSVAGGKFPECKDSQDYIIGSMDFDDYSR